MNDTNRVSRTSTQQTTTSSSTIPAKNKEMSDFISAGLITILLAIVIGIFMILFFFVNRNNDIANTTNNTVNTPVVSPEPIIASYPLSF